MNHRQGMIMHPIPLSARELGTLALLATRYCLQYRSSWGATLRGLLERLQPVLTKECCDSIETHIFCALTRPSSELLSEEFPEWEKIRKLYAGKPRE